MVQVSVSASAVLRVSGVSTTGFGATLQLPIVTPGVRVTSAVDRALVPGTVAAKRSVAVPEATTGVRLVAGIDLGTQSVKAVVCDEAMTVVGSHSVALTTQFPQPGWAEQDPRAWEAALASALAGALAGRGGEVVALAIAGQLDGCVAVDANTEPLHPALIWQDRRATAYVTAVDLETTGQVADASHMAPKIAWLRAHGIRAVRWHQPVSYLVARLTGAHSDVVGAGRTDSGVHAPGQVAHVDLEKELAPGRVADALNAHLRPHPVAVLKAEAAAPDFQARLDAVRRV